MKGRQRTATAGAEVDDGEIPLLGFGHAVEGPDDQSRGSLGGRGRLDEGQLVRPLRGEHGLTPLPEERWTAVTGSNQPHPAPLGRLE